MLKIFIDLDNTLCLTEGSDYESSQPILDRIRCHNKLINKRWKI